MAERTIGHKFRGHHASNRIGMVMSIFDSNLKDQIIVKCLTSRDWGSQLIDLPIAKIIDIDYRQSQIRNHYSVIDEGDDDTPDTYGDSYAEISKSIERIAEAEVNDVKFLFLGDERDLIMVGSVRDNICGQCAIGNHCTEITSISEDNILAFEIKAVSDRLGVKCRLENSPDEIYERDGDGKLFRGQVAVLSLGDFRDFILRRIKLYGEAVTRLNEEYDRLSNGMGFSNTFSKEIQKELLDIEIKRMNLAGLKMYGLGIPIEEEIALQRNIDNARK